MHFCELYVAGRRERPRTDGGRMCPTHLRVARAVADPEDFLRVRRNAADALYVLPATTTAAAAAAQGCTRQYVA